MVEWGYGIDVDGWMDGGHAQQDLGFRSNVLIVWWVGGNADGVYKRGHFDFDSLIFLIFVLGPRPVLNKP